MTNLTLRTILFASISVGCGSKSKAAPDETGTNAPASRDRALTDEGVGESDMNALLGKGAGPADWEGGEDVLANPRSVLRTKVATTELAQYGVDHRRLELPSGRSPSLWFSFVEAWPASAFEPAYRTDSEFPDFGAQEPVHVCTSFDVRGEFEPALREAWRNALELRLGPATSVEGLDTFYDHERQRRITWFDSYDSQLPILSVERYVALSSLFAMPGQIAFGGKNWLEFDSAQSFAEFGAANGWACQNGFELGDKKSGAGCVLPPSEFSTLHVDIAIRPEEPKRLRIVGRYLASPQQKGGFEAELIQAMSISFGEAKRGEEGSTIFANGAMLAFEHRGESVKWILEHQDTVK